MNDSEALYLLCVNQDEGEKDEANHHGASAIIKLAGIRSIIASPNLTALESYSQIVDLVKS